MTISAELFSIELLKDIFKDAHVLDVDLSNWDQRIIFCVAARAMHGQSPRLPIYLVEFSSVYDLRFEFRQNADSLKNPLDHFQWLLHDFSIKQLNNGLSLRFSGPQLMPIVNLQCKTASIRRISPDSLDKAFPNWDAPSSPLIRPGIEEIIKDDKGR